MIFFLVRIQKLKFQVVVRIIIKSKELTLNYDYIQLINIYIKVCNLSSIKDCF